MKFHATCPQKLHLFLKKKTSPIQHLPLSPTNTLLPLNGREFVRLGPLSELVKQRVPYPWTSPDTSGYLRFARLAFAGSGNSSLRQRPTPLIRHPGSGGDFLSIASFCRIAAHWGKSVSKKESANALDRLVADKRHWEDSCSGAEVPLKIPSTIQTQKHHKNYRAEQSPHTVWQDRTGQAEGLRGQGHVVEWAG